MKENYLLYYLFGLLFLFSPQEMKAQVMVLNNLQETYDLDDYLSITEDFSAKPSLDQLISPTQPFPYKPLSQWSEDFKPLQIYVSQFQVENKLADSLNLLEWVLKFSLTFTDISVFAVDNLGNVQTARSGFFTPLEHKSFAPKLKANIVKLRLLPQRFYTVYVVTDCARKSISPQFEMQLIPAEYYLRDLASQKDRGFIYLGLVLMLLIYNLIIYFFEKDRASIYYAIYLTSIIIFVTYNSGDLALLLTSSLFPETPQYIIYFKLFTYFGFIGYLSFIRSFLELSKLLPVWDKWFKFLSIVAIPLLILNGFLMNYSNFSYTIGDRVLLSFSMTFVLSIFSIVIPLFKIPDKKVNFIILGILSMGVGTLLTIGDRMQTIEFSTFYFKIGSVIEIIVFSLGLAYRRFLNAKERQQTRFQLEKARIIQEQEHKEAERLIELDTLKSKLYTNITHEFRTPLTVIMGITDQIKDNEREKELIQRSSSNLLDLINQMLDLAKAEDGRLKLNPVHRNIVEYIKYLTESFHSSAISKKIKLSFESETDSIFMDYDEPTVRKIIMNLLSNAIKFTPDGGQIKLKLSKAFKSGAPHLKISVEDSGTGISKEELPFVFDRFYQSDNSSTRKGEGTGIGLALIKEQVHLMKGEIQVSSIPGKGSTFTLLLPIKNSVQKNPKPLKENDAENAPAVLSAPSSSNKNINLSKELLILNTQTQDASKPLLLLLLLEDSQDILTYLQNCLEKDYSIQTAKNGKEGIEKALALIPDAIISDVMMPEKDGFEVTNTLKKNEKTSHIPIILLTAKATQESKLTGLSYGADAYLMKPFDKKELLIRVKKLLELRNKLKIHYSKFTYQEENTTDQPTDHELKFLEKIREIVLKNIAQENFSVPHMAKAMQMSQTQLYRKLKGVTGETPSQLIQTIKMEKAIQLLQSSELNISEVAFKLGFSDPNYFTRTFHSFHGKTPSSFRKTIK